MRGDTLEEDRFDFEDAEETLEGDSTRSWESQKEDSLIDQAKLWAEGTYDLGKYIAKPSAITVPVGAGLAAAANMPIEVGAGAGISGAALYKGIKHNVEKDIDFDGKTLGAMATLGAAGPAGGYAVSKADETASYGMEKLGDLADLGGEAYSAVTGAASDAASYAATEGVDLAGQAVGASDEVALGIGAGIAGIMAGSYGLGKIEEMRSDGSEFEDEYDL